MSDFGLSYLAAFEKSLEIVKRDSELFQEEDEHFSYKNQFKNLIEIFLLFDPDTSYEKLKAIENNETILREEVKFIIKTSLEKRVTEHNFYRRLNTVNEIRFIHLLEKYPVMQIKIDLTAPIGLVFPDVWYNILKENPNLNYPLPDSMKKYINFKKEYAPSSICLLPINAKYGGYLKACLHLVVGYHQLHEYAFLFGIENCIQEWIARLRIAYHSKRFSNEKRVDWFKNLGVNSKDCALWTKLFDKQYPDYKDIHKYFGQIA